jgi:hypothetical protein
MVVRVGVVPSLLVQATVWLMITPFLPLSSTSTQESVTLLEVMLAIERESGGAVGAVEGGEGLTNTRLL